MADRSLIIACGALAREIQQLKTWNRWEHMDIQCLEASLHNTPEKIPGRLAERLNEVKGRYKKILIAYSDCGTNGEIDKLIEGQHHITRLPGPHCFAAFAGVTRYESLMRQSPGTFWLTDFLARHFQTMVVKTLQLDHHPELKQCYFGNYTRVNYISQVEDEDLLQAARLAADFLGLEFHHLPAGYGELEQSLKWCAA